MSKVVSKPSRQFALRFAAATLYCFPSHFALAQTGPGSPSVQTTPTCREVAEGGPVLARLDNEQIRPASFCPALEALGQVFKRADTTNYAPRIKYTQPTDGFFTAVASSMNYYGRSRTSFVVEIGNTVSVTLNSLDTVDDASGFKRNKLGMILERIRNGDARGRHKGRLCAKYSEVSDGSFLDWGGTTILKYVLPAIIRLFRKDPLRAIDKFDAMITIDRETADPKTSPIREIQFVRRGGLPVDCNQITSS